MIKPLLVPATDKGVATLARLVSKHLGFASMTGAKVTSLSPLLIREDGDVDDTAIAEWVTAPVRIGQAAVVVRQGTRRVLMPLNP